MGDAEPVRIETNVVMLGKVLGQQMQKGKEDFLDALREAVLANDALCESLINNVETRTN